jgi:hypothetical protein
MPYVQVYATELFSAGRASPPCRRISSPLHDMRAHRVRSRRLRGSPVSLLRVRLQRIHTGRCRIEACGASERRRPWGRSSALRELRRSITQSTRGLSAATTPRASTEVLEPLPEIGSPPSIGGRGAAAGSLSPHAFRGVERNLPAALAGAAQHIPIVLTLANREEGSDDGRIGHVPVLARRPVAEGARVTGVEPSTSVDARL